MSDADFRHCRFGSYVLDRQTRELRDGDVDGRAVPLTAKAFDTLCFLIAHRRRVVGKDELLASVWAGRVVEDNNLMQAIAALRRAFGTSAGDHRYIVTVPGRGYRFVAEVEEGRPHVPSGDDPPVAATSGPGTWARRPAMILGGLLFTLALLAIVAWHWREPSGGALPSPQKALAVMPFRSLSRGPRDEELEVGLADTLITRLSRSRDLRVRSLASARRLSGDPPADALAAGRQLGAAYVVDGTTQRIGDRVRVNARLVSVATGDALWGDTFDAPIDRVFTLQDSIGDAVSSALSLAPVAATASARSACDGSDSTAYRALLRAEHELHRRAPDTIASYQQAISLDPVCARAYAGLTMGYLFMAHNDRDPAEVFPLAKATAAQALRLDPNSAEANMASGRELQLHAWAWKPSEAALRRAVALNPSFADAHFSLAHLLVLTGRFDEGLAEARQAVDLDPLSPLMNALDAGFLSAAGQAEAARRQLQRTLELEPDFWIALLVRGGLELDRGDTAAALADLKRSAERSNRASQVLAVLAAAHVAAGERAQALAILRELDARDAAGYVPATSLAAVHNALGQTDIALDLLERAYREHDIRMAFLRIDARWNNLRMLPRFRALARRMQLESSHADGRF